MNTDQHNPPNLDSGLQLHPEQASPNLKLYAVALHLTHLRRAFVKVLATTEAEAMQLAEETHPAAVPQWQDIDLYTQAACAITAEPEEGQSDE